MPIRFCGIGARNTLFKTGAHPRVAPEGMLFGIMPAYLGMI